MSPLWIFGYGSLMWRPDIPFEARRIGYIRDWVRRFYQGSTDHRGVPGDPGRVVTLLPERGAVTWGVAFRVPETEREAVLANLDHREKGGYDRDQLDFTDRENGAVISVLAYHASPDNGNYLGPAPPEEMVAQIREAVGPSGPNREYLLELDRFMIEHGITDPHVHDLAERLRKTI